jgi:SAM-dependent methyltransferase
MTSTTTWTRSTPCSPIRVRAIPDLVVAGGDAAPVAGGHIHSPTRRDAAARQLRRLGEPEALDLAPEVGRGLAEHLGYPDELLDAIPGEALASFAGVGYHLDLAALAPGESVLDLGSGSGTDVFCASARVGRSGRVVGVDFTHEQLSTAERLRVRGGFEQIGFVEASIDDLPFDDATFDVVISNGVIDLPVVKSGVFGEAARSSGEVVGSPSRTSSAESR